MSVRKDVTSKYQPQHQWQFTSATRDNTSNSDMSRRRVPLFFKKKRKQYKHLHGEKKKKVSQMVWMRTVITYLVDGQSTREQREGEKIGNEISKSRKREREREKTEPKHEAEKKDKNKTDTKRENTSYESRQRERCTAWLPLMRSSSFPVFIQAVILFFLSLFRSWSLRLSQTCRPCDSLTFPFIIKRLSRASRENPSRHRRGGGARNI